MGASTEVLFASSLSELEEPLKPTIKTINAKGIMNRFFLYQGRAAGVISLDSLIYKP
jgi:hypothetical protein